MRGVGLLAVVLGAVLAGMGMVFGAPAHLDEPVRLLLGLGFAGAFTVVLRGPIGSAIADQIRGGTTSNFEGRLLAQLDDLTAELQAVRDELTGLHERMDFTERVLTRGADPRPLGPGVESRP